MFSALFYSIFAKMSKLWPKNGAHAHISAFVFCHNSVIFGTIELNFLWDWELKIPLFIDWWWGIQIMMIIFQFWFFGPHLAGKCALPSRVPLMDCGLQTRPKSSWPTGRTFWANHYLQIMFSKISGVNPLNICWNFVNMLNIKNHFFGGFLWNWTENLPVVLVVTPVY